jgi:hypothetical protein
MPEEAQVTQTQTIIEPIETKPDWNPRHDPDFADEWIDFLRAHRGESWHPTDVWETHDPWQRLVLLQVAYEEVEAARRLGDVIEGDRRVGYCYMRRSKPRWLRLTKPRPSCSHVSANGCVAVLDGQLPLTERQR